jgi:hypothetical protein
MLILMRNSSAFANAVLYLSQLWVHGSVWRSHFLFIFPRNQIIIWSCCCFSFIAQLTNMTCQTISEWKVLLGIAWSFDAFHSDGPASPPTLPVAMLRAAWQLLDEVSSEANNKCCRQRVFTWFATAQTIGMRLFFSVCCRLTCSGTRCS